MALAEKAQRPTKRHAHKDGMVDAEFVNVFDVLGRVHLGPFRFFYDENYDALFIQVRDKTNPKNYVSLVRIDTQTGDINVRGAANVMLGDSVGSAGRM